jgi:hypothetical protein
VNTEKCYTARILSEMLNDDSNYLFLLILKPLLFEINNLNIIFQKNNVNIGHAYNDLCSTIVVIAKKIMKPNFLSDNNIDIVLDNIDNELAYLSPDKCDYGVDYFTNLYSCGLSPDKKNIIEGRAFRYLKSLLNELCKRLPDSLKLLQALQLLSPNIGLNKIRPKLKDLPFTYIFLDSNSLAKCELQWEKLSTVEWSQFYDDAILENSYSFWPNVLQFKDAGGNFVFTELATYVLTCLSLPSSNAVVERAFSVMAAVKPKCRNRMQTQMLEAILRLRLDFYSKNICCKNFSPTEGMFKKFNSKDVYGADAKDEEILEEIVVLWQ